MMAIPATLHLAPDPDAADRPDCTPLSANARLDHLFRGWLRDRHVHPLIHLIRQYRAHKTS
jgi:hypothetical protein